MRERLLLELLRVLAEGEDDLPQYLHRMARPAAGMLQVRHIRQLLRCGMFSWVVHLTLQSREEATYNASKGWRFECEVRSIVEGTEGLTYARKCAPDQYARQLLLVCKSIRRSASRVLGLYTHQPEPYASTTSLRLHLRLNHKM